MSTGSSASDAEDYDASCLRRTEDDGGHKQSKKDPRQSHRDAANARERARMRVLSKAFSRLKTTLPWVPADTKLSKLDTLRLASNYISHLRQLLQEEDSCVQPSSLTWPFLTSAHSEDQDMSTTGRFCGRLLFE
ncbi:musculin [Nerophis lumbriciformis]|uniref:musculin n=1 Tax=Nerophis lumbriciformis TaxID=546530 RepID=UPI002ADFAF01|nr:musculin [Nerophis lumbriciformis]